ncbi:MAG: galactose-1-phosphate uridylyltransferase [Candidatus Diapherotrites archaeon]|nr:galactose-1-phosphate uridylyltransferase [Candidatus Diapherotrites archaeon]
MVAQNELRKDYITNKWVIVAEKRSLRPTDLPLIKYKKGESISKTCPFCPGNEHMTPPTIMEVKKNGKWDIRIIENKFPALSKKTKMVSSNKQPLVKMTAFGTQEVLIETNNHSRQFFENSKTKVKKILELLVDRRKKLLSDKQIEYVLLFKNFGRECGASLSHSHIQISALPIVPPTVADEINGSNNYYNENHTCPYCDIADKESKSQRFVSSNNNFLLFTPFASIWPYELWILSKKHIQRLEDFSGSQLLDLAEIMIEAIKRLNTLFPDIPYNLVIHDTPADNSFQYYHFHIEIYPKYNHKTFAGLEKGGDVYINAISPERAAKHLKEVKI